MSSEIQESVYKKIGQEEMKIVFDPVSGKIVESGKIHREINPETVEQSMAHYRSQSEELERQLSEARAKLEKYKDVEEDEEIKKFNALIEKRQKIVEKKQAEDFVRAKSEELEFMKENLKDQQRIVEDWRSWKKKFAHTEKKEGE